MGPTPLSGLGKTCGMRRSPWPKVCGIVAVATVLGGLLAVPIRRPRIFGDELIYWELSRAFAWTGHFTVRGGAAPRYGYVYPAVLAVAHRLGGDERTAYAIAQGLNAVVFSLSAIPAYLIARRVLRTQASALLVALLAVVLPSCLLTSAIMTENAFYPLFLTSALLMLRSLERPTLARQLLVVGAAAVTFLARAQALVLLPAYLLAVVLLALPVRRLRASLREHVPTLLVLVCAGIGAALVPGESTLGPYHVLVASYRPTSIVHWALANTADFELYLGVVPLAAFGILLLPALTSTSLSPALGRVVILTATLGAGVLATVAVLSASPYGLQRIHERNLFYVAPLVLAVFFAWLESGAPRPSRLSAVVATTLVLLPLAIPSNAIAPFGVDGLAVMMWWETGLRGTAARLAMVAAAALAVAIFLLSPRRAALVGICIAAFAATLVVGELHAANAVGDAAQWRDYSWVDRTLGPSARVVALWATTHSGPQFERVGGLWSDEFFNRSVVDVASADGPLPDGLPVETLRIGRDGCLAATFRSRPQYVVVETTRALSGSPVAVSPSGRARLYRLPPGFDPRCFARLRRSAK
jgi:dolichyl-phosphate-mannose-protein mannosyltransferase